MTILLLTPRKGKGQIACIVLQLQLPARNLSKNKRGGDVTKIYNFNPRTNCSKDCILIINLIN